MHKHILLFGFFVVLGCCCSVGATPPQMGNRLLQMQRDQMSDALGESSPNVIPADSRILLEGKSRDLSRFRSTPTKRDPQLQIKKIVNAFNELSRQNQKLKKRIEVLESRLRACEQDESQSN